MNVELYKKLLKEKGMSYEDLAQRTGLSLGCIKRIMSGIAKYPRADTIQAIESALGLDGSERHQNASSDLAEDEFALIAQYRLLSPTLKRIAVTLMDILAGSPEPTREELKKILKGE